MATGLNKYREMYTSAGGPQAGGGNPFAGMLSSMGGGGQAAVGASPAAASRGGGGFNALLTPDAPGILGILGKLAGNPTREEYLFQKAGQANLGGANKLTQLIAEGLPPQQAVVEFMKTPEGMEFFTSVPNASDEIRRIITNTVPEAQDPLQVAPGNAVVSPQGQEIYRNPTTEVQDFTGLAQVANLPQEQIEKLAAAKLAEAQQGDPTQTEAAIAEMVALGEITPDMGRKIRSGVLQFQPVLDPTGKTIGHVVVDLTNPQAPQIIQPANGRTNLPATPGEESYAPGVRDDGYDPDERAEPGVYLKEFGNPADIVEGAGIVPYMSEKLGGFAAMFSPQLAGAGKDSANKRRALDQIRNDARALKESGRYLAKDLELLDSILPNTGGITESPVQAAAALIQYNMFLDQRIAEATDRYQNATVAEERGKAYAELGDLDKAKMNVPDVDSLRAKIGELEARKTSPAGDAVREGFGNVGKAIEGVKGVEQEVEKGFGGEQRPEFNDENSLREALKSGKLKLGAKIIYKGKPVTVKAPSMEGRR